MFRNNPVHFTDICNKFHLMQAKTQNDITYLCIQLGARMEAGFEGNPSGRDGTSVKKCAGFFDHCMMRG